MFPLTHCFQQYYGPEVLSVCNRNEYQESFLEETRGQRVRLTTSPPSVSGLYRKRVISKPQNLIALYYFLYNTVFLVTQFVKAD
jgi:hypothetical protein